MLRLWDLIRGQRDQIRRQREQIEWFEWECESLSMLLEFRDHASAQGIRGWVFQDAPIRCRPQDIPDLRAALAIAEARAEADARALHRARAHERAELEADALAEAREPAEPAVVHEADALAREHEAAMGVAAEDDAEGAAFRRRFFLTWIQLHRVLAPDELGVEDLTAGAPAEARSIPGGIPERLPDDSVDLGSNPPLSDLTESDESPRATSAMAYSDH